MFELFLGFLAYAGTYFFTLGIFIISMILFSALIADMSMGTALVLFLASAVASSFIARSLLG